MAISDTHATEPVSATPATGLTSVDVARVRLDFPALQQMVHSHPLVYLDNAATTQKPRSVIEVESGIGADLGCKLVCRELTVNAPQALANIGSAARAPDSPSPSGCELSKPSHVTVTTSVLNPANQVSR